MQVHLLEPQYALNTVVLYILYLSSASLPLPLSLFVCLSSFLLSMRRINVYRFILCLDSLDILQNKSRPIYILPVDYVLYLLDY